MRAPVDYDAPHVACEPCPTCTAVTRLPVYHPKDRPCTIQHLMVPPIA